VAEPLSGMVPNNSSVKGQSSWNHGDQRLLGVSVKTRFSEVDYFSDRTSLEGDYWRAASHRFDHHNAKRLIPLDGEQESTGIFQ
jgi:hypothetical protein